MGSYRVISSDSHIFEPSDLWTSRVEPQFRDRAPTLSTAQKMPQTGGCSKG